MRHTTTTEVGRDDAAIKAGHAAHQAADRGNEAFFRRLQLEELPVQSAMLLLRQCATPRMNYALRCTPPECIAEQAANFDDQVLQAAATGKLRLWQHEQDERVQRILRSKLSHGGFGLTSALQTSPAAYLGSLAAVRDAPALAVYCKEKHPLPVPTQLHGWIQHAIDTHVRMSPESATSLPTAASTFFHHFATASSSDSSALQSTLSEQATSHMHEASLTAAKQARRAGNGTEQALLMSISAPRAWTWKTVLPTQKTLVLNNSTYRLAARLNLGLEPEASGAVCVDAKPCPKCETVTEDAWHHLSCAKGGTKLRHDMVLHALYHAALAVGAQAEREPKGLSWGDGKRPDLQVYFPGTHLLSDVVVSHPLAPGYAGAHSSRSRFGHTRAGVARRMQHEKHNKYDHIAERHGAKLLPFAVETCGGLAPDAVTFVKALAEEGDEQLSLWSKDSIAQHVHAAIAIAVQAANALVYTRVHGGAPPSSAALIL
jgi:hypothetical protein